MGILLSIKTQPYYAQVALFDPTVMDSYPDWGTGEAEAVTSGSGLAVETRPDYLGPVTIEVWTTGFDYSGKRKVFEGELKVRGDHRGVDVGSVTGNDLHAAAVPRGTHRVCVYANHDRGDVDSIYFVLPTLGSSDKD